MIRKYLGAVCGSEGSYGIVFRDFPGCVSAGDTISEVLAMGAEALGGHVATMLDAGEAIPEASVHTVRDVEDWLRGDGEADEEPWIGIFPVEIDVPSNAGTVIVRMKAELVSKIAAMAGSNAERIGSLGSREFIEQAVEHELERYRKSA
jgi:predicted RNase H-like HicB family nuclease